MNVRRKRLRELIETEYGSQAAFVDRTGINQGELSGLLRKKSFGERKARAIEERAKLRPMYLDTANEEAEQIQAAEEPKSVVNEDLSQEQKELLALIQNMQPEVREALLKVASALPPTKQKLKRIVGNARPVMVKGIIKPAVNRNTKRRDENDS